MQSIEEKALETYHHNLEYFKNNYKDLHKKLMLFETIISSAQYEEKYVLDYKEEGYFDIQELSTGQYLYDENSLIHAEVMVKSVSLQRKGGVFKALRFNTLTDEQTKVIDESELSFHNALWATATVTHYTQKYVTPESFMKRINKIIFIDIGLGLHLKGLVEKLNPQVIFIKEANLETFRLSLFVTDYKTVFENRFVFFSITDNETEEEKNFLDFLNKGNNLNLYLKHIPFKKDYTKDIRKLQSYVFNQSYINYGYSAELFRFANSLLYLTQDYSFLNVSKVHQESFFSDKPLLLLFSGPSTSKKIEWIKENRNKFIVVAALSTCRLLNNFNISPDIVIHIDPGEGTKALFNDIDAEEYFKNTIAILASNVNEDTIGRFERSKVYLVEQGTYYKRGFGRLSAPSVGEYTYALSLILGARKLFLLGIDLALDSKTLQTHSDFHKSNQKGILDEEGTSMDPKKSIVYTKGNFSEQVPTTAGFKISIDQFSIFTHDIKKDGQNVYNLSEGAFLEGATPLQIDEYDWDTFQELDSIEKIKNINLFLSSIGEAKFNDEDKKQLQKQITEAKKLEKYIKKYQKKKYANVQSYLDGLTKLAWDIADMDYKTGSNLAEVYYQYFPIVQSYIFELFNTKDLDSPHKHIAQINSILTKQLLKMSKYYIKEVGKYLK